MKDFKIIFVANVARDLYNFRLGLMKCLKKNGYKVLCVVPQDEFKDKFLKEGFSFICLNELRREEKNLIKNILLILKLYRIYKNERPCLVLHYTLKPVIFGNIASKIAGVKSLSIITGLGSFFIRRNLLKFLFICLYKISLRFTERVFFLNEDNMNFFVERIIIPKYKAFLIRGEGIDTNYYNPDFCKNKSIEKDKFVFLLISRMIWDKGIGEYVEAAQMVKEKYPNTEFWLLGPLDRANPTAISYEKIREWQDKNIIKYLGSTDDVRPFICESDAVVLPSYGEGLPRSLLEAISMGKPVITTNSVGCREVVENDKNGFLVPVKDPKALAEAMIKFIELPKEKIDMMRKYSREKAVKEFSEKIIIDKYLKVINEILNKNIGRVKYLV